MATTTPNYGLTKPDLSELYDIGVQNANMDLIDSLTTSKAEMYYHVGDTVNIANVLCAGILTGAQKELRFFVPLSKPIGSDVSNASVSGNWYIRHADGGYIANNVTLASLGTTALTQTDCGIQIRVQLTNAVSFSNNSVVTAMGWTGATLTFS